MPYSDDPPEDAPWTTAPPSYQSLEWWNARGVSNEDIFNAETGQLHPNFRRTARGYEHVGVDASTPVPTHHTAPTIGGGKTPQQIEAEGREADRIAGRVGGYMRDGVWVNGSPMGSGGGGGGGDFGGAMSPGDFQGFGTWPSYQGQTFDPGPQFTYKDFVSPTAESMLQEPGFQFRMDQGRKALESSAAGKGVLRSGGTLKDILGYGQNFASQEYGNVWNRALGEYDTNRANQFGIHQAQYGQRGDQYRFAEDANRFGYNAKQQQAELDAKEAFDRWSKSGDWTRDIFTAGAND